jgi:acylphosphatase
MDIRKLYKIHITGRVQGVGFRWSAKSAAKNLGVTGFVRNLPDGSVYIEAEGSEEQLDAFIAWCRTGPGIGHVREVQISEYPLAGYEDFSIEH